MTYFLAILPLRRLFFAVGLLFCAVSLAIPASAAFAQDKDEERTRLRQVTQDIQQLQQLLQKIRSERSAIEARLEQTEQEISQVNKQRKITEQELKEAQKTEKKQQAVRKELERKLADKRQNVAQSIKATYLAGQSPHLKLLLNQDDPARTNRMLSYYQRFNETQTNNLRTLYETSEKLALIEQELAGTRQQVQDRYQRLRQQEQRLKESRASRTKTLKLLSSQMSQSNNRLNQLETEQQNLQKVLASVMSLPRPVPEVADVPFDKVRGKLRWPLKGRVVHKYGDRRDSTRFRWNGIFIRAKAGAKVIAPHNGRVVFSNWMPSFGQLLIIDHGKGYMTLYAHNQELLKSEGDWVLSGEPIARVGDSGGLSNPGLYFEVRHKGKPSNPASWLTTSR